MDKAKIKKTPERAGLFSAHWVRQYGELLLHLVFVLPLSGLLLYTSLNEEVLQPDFAKRRLIFTLIGGILLTFYVHTFWLIPRFLRHRRWLSYFGLLLLLSLFLELLRTLLTAKEASFAQTFLGQNNVSGAVLFGLLISFAYRFTRDWIVNIGLIDRLEAERNAMELAFLKSQVDPHFLFNTLNNLYARALSEDSPQTAAGIARLGTLMRYNLHDSATEWIALEKEIEYIREYVALQKMRLTEKTQVNLQVDKPEAAQWKIAPMLLIPFVENAFKHGVSSREPGQIVIRIKMDGGWLYMEVKNRIVQTVRAKTSGGIGLTNVRNRLNLLYPNRHELQIAAESEQYNVVLTIDLNP